MSLKNVEKWLKNRSTRIDFKPFLKIRHIVLSLAVSEERALQITYAKRSVAVVLKIKQNAEI